MLILFFISLFASVIGAICGIGGGVIIKPCLDLFNIADVATASFLSGCTVLSMSCYSVAKMQLSKERSLDTSAGIPLGIGAAVGGILGKQLFVWIKEAAASVAVVGALQAACLAVMTIGTLLYTVFKSRIRAKKLTGLPIFLTVGLALGLLSSFLGIGGGPINLVVLFYLFGMDTKSAGANSLCIIFISQIASLLTTLISNKVPDFQWPALLLMAAGGILGGILGRRLNSKMDNGQVDKLFIGLMIVIIFICAYNFFTNLQLIA